MRASARSGRGGPPEFCDRGPTGRAAKASDKEAAIAVLLSIMTANPDYAATARLGSAQLEPRLAGRYAGRRDRSRKVTPTRLGPGGPARRGHVVFASATSLPWTRDGAGDRRCLRRSSPAYGLQDHRGTRALCPWWSTVSCDRDSNSAPDPLRKFEIGAEDLLGPSVSPNVIPGRNAQVQARVAPRYLMHLA
jgi:hypothetical protein